MIKISFFDKAHLLLLHSPAFVMTLPLYPFLTFHFLCLSAHPAAEALFYYPLKKDFQCEPTVSVSCAQTIMERGSKSGH